MSKKSIEEAWSEFYKSCQTESYDDMIAQGWKTISDVAKECNMPRRTVETMLRDGKLDSVKKRVIVSGCARKINFIRPKGIA